MRSKTGIAPRLASTRDVSGRYANAPYPQWMKALEDKYQKLHTKIMQSTNVSSLRPGTLQRSRRAEACISRLSNRTRKTPLPRGSAVQSGSDIGVTGQEGVGQEDDGVTDNQVVQVDKLQMDNGGDVKDDTLKPKEESNVENTADNRENQAIGSETGAEIEIRIENELEVDRGQEEGSKPAQSLDCLPSPRNVTTSVSRISNKTSRSCPAVIQTPRDCTLASNIPLSTMEKSRRPTRRKNLKLFSRMSTEAQHAVNETLIEMGAENSSLKPEASFVTQETSKNENHNSIPNGRLNRTQSPEPSLSSTKSCASSGISELTDLRDRRALGGSQCLFPDITPRSSLLPKSTSIQSLNKTEELRIPGVGRYNVLKYKRERTFQITFGDFDIRYRDIISCDRRGSETPPSDIREKAIAKCNEWLEKYTPR